jgi:hypothetical protein
MDSWELADSRDERGANPSSEAERDIVEDWCA